MINPSLLRKETLTNRNNLSKDEIVDKSLAIENKLLSLDAIAHHQSIFVYVSFRSEVATEHLIDTLISMGKTVTVPITRIKEKRLDAIQITNRDNDLVPGYCNIPEPTESLCSTNIVAPESIETILLPGSVFDKRGGRFGYGGGYYDRFLAAIPSATRIGLAFDLQIVEEAPLQDHDEILDLVITENMIINGER